MLLGVAEVHRVDDQVDVGRVFPCHRPAWNLDEFQTGLMECTFIVRKAAPIRVGLLADDLAFFDQALKHALDVEAIVAILEPKSEVLEVDENRERRNVWHAHPSTRTRP